MDKRITFGRRRTDWLIPLGFLAVGVIAAFWASYNRTEKVELLRQKENLEAQVVLLERIIANYEKESRKNGKPIKPGRAVVKPGTVRPAGKP